MKKIIVGGLAGGIIMFIWGWAAWSIFSVHAGSMLNIPNEDAVVTAMSVNMDKKAIYVFPGLPTASDQASMDDYTQKMQQGPVGMIVYDPQGSDPMAMNQFIGGIIIAVILACMAAWFLSRSTAAASSYIARVAYCGMLGVFISIAAYIVNWNWMGYSFEYTSAWIIDTVIGWVLAGLGIGAIVKTPKVETL